MANWLKIPIDFPTARRADPPSSHVAGENAHKEGARLHRVLLLRLITERPGMTSKEMAAYITLDRHQIARRLPELRALGLVQNGTVDEAGELTWYPV